MTKVIANILLAEADGYVGDHQSAYQPARTVLEVRRTLAMSLDHYREKRQPLVLYKRDKNNGSAPSTSSGWPTSLTEGEYSWQRRDGSNTTWSRHASSRSQARAQQLHGGSR